MSSLLRELFSSFAQERAPLKSHDWTISCFLAAPPPSRRRSRIRPARGASNESSTAQVCLPGRSFLVAGPSVALILGNRAPLGGPGIRPALAAQASPSDSFQFFWEPQHTRNNTPPAGRVERGEPAVSLSGDAPGRSADGAPVSVNIL